MAQADTNFRNDISQIGNYYVKNNTGSMVPLSSVVSYKVTETAPLISHFNIYRSAEVDGSAKQGYSSGQALDALRESFGFNYKISGNVITISKIKWLLIIKINDCYAATC